jgi:ATP-dependent exoDNAse (exonuclease V) beta subunit
LHGIIDLLYQDQSGDWHLLDWKTEWTPRAEIEENSHQHMIQMAAYAQAAQNPYKHNLKWWFVSCLLVWICINLQMK